MKAAETNLRNLLEGTKQFRVPLFQILNLPNTISTLYFTI